MPCARAGARFEGEVTFFRNDIDNFIFRNPISDEEFAEREDEFDDRFNVEHGGEQDDPHGGELPFVEFVGRDATLWGFEAHGDVKLNRWTAEFTFDMVRGDALGDRRSDCPGCRRTGASSACAIAQGGFQAGTAVNMVAAQDRVFGEETPDRRLRHAPAVRLVLRSRGAPC